MALGQKNGTLSEEQAIEAGSPIRKLKTLFPNTPLAKHTPLDIFLAPPAEGKPRALIFRDLGAIESDWVATEFVMHYFEGNGASPPVNFPITQADSFADRQSLSVEEGCCRDAQEFH